MAHRKPLGTTCSLYYDAPERDVEIGDVIETGAAKPSHYRVIRRRQQQSGIHVGRWHLKCVRIAPEDVEEDDTVHPLHWYPRGK